MVYKNKNLWSVYLSRHTNYSKFIVVIMPLLTIERFFSISRSLKLFLFGRFSFPLPYNDTIYFSSSYLFIRYMCGNC